MIVWHGCLIDQSAVIQNGSSLGIGTLVFEGAIVGANSALGDICVLNRNSVGASGSLLRMGRVLVDN